MKRKLFAGILLLAGSLACASAPTTAGTNLQVITLPEIQKTNAQNAYDVVKKLRPNYLVSRGKITANADDSRTPNVYLNGQYFGSTEMLVSVPVSSIAEIRLYHAGEVPVQLSQNNPNGLIAITTK